MQRKMNGAVFIAIAATIGNLLQGWDNATIAGAVLYIKREFHLESEPTIEGLIVAMSLIGATIITTFSGPVSDWVGRRPMLIISSVFYFVSGLMMLWAPNVYMLLLARLIDGFGIGLAVTLIPVYISETALADIRGLLNTLPQFSGSGGMFFSYCMVFTMSLMPQPNWRLMLGVFFCSLSSIFFSNNILFKGYLVPQKSTFPSRMKALADYVHSKGLKLGIYSDAGYRTCSKRMPGSIDHEEQDAKTFAAWGIYYLKYGNCNNGNVKPTIRYPLMTRALMKTGRPIFFLQCFIGFVTPHPPSSLPQFLNSGDDDDQIPDFVVSDGDDHKFARVPDFIEVRKQPVDSLRDSLRSLLRICCG